MNIKTAYGMLTLVTDTNSNR